MTTKATLCYDTEVYRDYFLAAFLNVETDNVVALEMYPDHPLDTRRLQSILERYRIVTFNGNGYDMLITAAALKGATCAKLKEISDKIIKNNMRQWHLGIDPPRCDHIDLIEVAPGVASLKIYGGRLHCPKLQDLPIDEAASISPEDRENLRTYNVNDLQTTKALWLKLQPQIELRETMTKVWGVDVRSKSDAQIAETLIVKEVSKAIGKVERPEVPGGTRFNYTAPKFVRFEAPQFQSVLDIAQDVSFLVTDGGTVQLPDELKNAKPKIGNGLYRLGIGGLHSSEKCVSHYADDETEVSDHDVTSYYPEIILTQNVSPPHMGMAFSKVFRGFKDNRVVAKKAGKKSEADALKIVCNGAGGKLNSKWSKLYYPQGFIHMTLTGQLSLLMLIERFERAGIEVASANTDGVTVKLDRSLIPARDALIREWERETGFRMEDVRYRSIHFRDVNSYAAIKDDGAFKLKGAFAMEALCPALGAGLMTNPSNEICIEAAAYFLRDGTPIEDTVRACVDIRRFVTIRQVKGGAIDQQGDYLGKAVRWYYAKDVDGPLRYKLNGYTVPRSDGARAALELPEGVPSDLDHEWYIEETQSILRDVGVDPDAYLVRDLV